MNPVRKNLSHRFENEWAQMHLWVRNGKILGVNGQVVAGYDVNVKLTVSIRAVGIAMRRGREFFFNTLGFCKEFRRLEIRLEVDSEIYKVMFRLEAPRFGMMEVRACRHRTNRSQPSHSIFDEGNAVA